MNGSRGFDLPVAYALMPEQMCLGRRGMVKCVMNSTVRQSVAWSSSIFSPLSLSHCPFHPPLPRFPTASAMSYSPRASDADSEGSEVEVFTADDDPTVVSDTNTTSTSQGSE